MILLLFNVNFGETDLDFDVPCLIACVSVFCKPSCATMNDELGRAALEGLSSLLVVLLERLGAVEKQDSSHLSGKTGHQ